MSLVALSCQLSPLRDNPGAGFTKLWWIVPFSDFTSLLRTDLA